MDYTNFTPVNTANSLVDATKWQPLVVPVSGSAGQFCVQG
jgi:hypothetical protein